MLDQLLEYSPNFGMDTLLLLPVLVALEAVLSADNAIALAAIAQGLEGPQLQRRALNFGLIIAFCLRIILILTATWVLRYWQFELLGAIYLLWLVYQHFSPNGETDAEGDSHHPHKPRFTSLLQAIPMIALTDLAFSLDSVTTAIAISRETWLVITGGLIGVIALRFMAGLFIRWLEIFTHLEDAGFVTVSFVGLRLLLRVINSDFVPPEWLMVILIALVFIWGFSEQVDKPAEPDATAMQAADTTLRTDLDSDLVTDQREPQEISAD
jgi:YkoY family integral membrane protein